MADILLEKVSKDYRMGELTIHAAREVSFQVKNGELAIILDMVSSLKSVE